MFTYGQMGHRAFQCPQSQQRPQQLSFPPPTPTQQASGSGGYTQTGREGAYHYQGDAAPYTSGQQQYSQDPQYQRVGTLSIKEDLYLINHIQPEDLSGTKGDSPSMERLLLVVQDLRGSRVSRGKDVVFMPTKVAVNDSRIKGVSTTCHCKMPRTIRI
ncbi:hypothetical protein ACFX15_018360 [Malus domestica]